MTDALTPLAWWWIIEHQDHATFKVVDQYDSDDIYGCANPHEQPNITAQAAHMQRACFIADFCVLVVEDNRSGETIGWAQIILDGGMPQVSDMSDNAFGRLVEQSIDVSNAVLSGALSLSEMLYEITPDNFTSYMENNNG